MKKLDISKWNRREHFEFFSGYRDPIFGIVSPVDCTEAFSKSRRSGPSFFALYLFAVMRAVNAVENFRYRIVDNEVLIHEHIHCTTTIGRKDGTFAFSFVPYDPDFETFNLSLQAEIKEVNNSKGLRIHDEKRASRQDVIYFSAVPWTSFTGLKHAQKGPQNSVPMIAVGKAFEQADKMLLPVSVHAHHALMDGFHVAQFFQHLEQYLGT